LLFVTSFLSHSPSGTNIHTCVFVVYTTDTAGRYSSIRVYAHIVITRIFIIIQSFIYYSPLCVYKQPESWYYMMCVCVRGEIKKIRRYTYVRVCVVHGCNRGGGVYVSKSEMHTKSYIIRRGCLLLFYINRKKVDARRDGMIRLKCLNPLYVYSDQVDPPSTNQIKLDRLIANNKNYKNILI